MSSLENILNKITPEKFRKLSEEFISLGLDSPNIFKGVILLIFEKALEEPKYSSMYAQLCKKLSEEVPNFESNSTSNSYSSTSNSHCFGRFLLAKCRDEFENRRKAIEAFGDGILSPEEEEQRALAKHKMLGNIKFICELGKQKLVQQNILHLCIQELCKKKGDDTLQNKTEDLECLCKIMKTIGCLLDTVEAKSLMDQYFIRIKKYAQNSELPSRIRFMLQDVLELRNNQWVPRQIQSEQNPKTIVQIRAEAGLFMPPQFGNIYPNYSQISMPLRSQYGFLPQNSFLSNHMQLGQRELDDLYSSLAHPGLATTLGTGPGVINSDILGDQYNYPQRRLNLMNSLPSQMPLPHTGQAGNMPHLNSINNHINPMTGHSPFMQYRVSHGSMENRKDRNFDKDVGRQNINNINSSLHLSQQQQLAQLNAQNQGNRSVGLPPRLQRKAMQQQFQGLAQQSQSQSQTSRSLQSNHSPLIGPNALNNRTPMMTSKPLLPSSNHFNAMDGNDISLRPAQNSIVLKPHIGMNKNKITMNQMANINSNSKPVDNQNCLTASIGSNKSNNKINDVPTNMKSVASTQTSKETIIKTTGEVLEEFISDKANIDDVTKKISELKIPKNFQSDVLITTIKRTLDKAENERESASKFLTQLKNKSVFHNNVFITAFKNLLNQMSDMELDIPRVKSYVAGFIARAIVDSIISLKDVYDLVEGGQHYPLLLLCLQHLHQTQGQEWLSEIFNTSKINLIMTLPEIDRVKERLADILKDRDLSFLYPILRIEFDLTKQLMVNECTPSALYRWIKDNVDANLRSTPEFINVLFTCIAKYVTEKAKQLASEATFNEGTTPNVTITSVSDYEKEVLSKYRAVFHAFLHERHNLQLMVLYSLQSYWYELGFPKEMLLRWFIFLYDLEIIEDEVFLKWKEDINDEYPGKGQALFQVNKWFEWLEKAEEEEEDEEEEEEEDEGSDGGPK